jgi:outer membrane protein assembly factor BamC
VVWQRLPTALEKVGMKVTDSTRSTGSMAATYKPLSDSAGRNWAHATQPGSGDYKLRSATSITAVACSLSIRKVIR